jgi:hypothetical protein
MSTRNPGDLSLAQRTRIEPGTIDTVPRYAVVTRYCGGEFI